MQLHLLRGRRLGAGALVAVCLVLALSATAVIDQLGTTTQVADGPPPPDSAHLMTAMVAAGEIPAPGVAAAVARQPRVGDAAPDFHLTPVDRTGSVDLAGFRGRPLVLAFGSLTCDRFCRLVPELNRLYRAYGRGADFLFVSITEAGHSTGALAVAGPIPERPADRPSWLARGLRAVGLAFPAAFDRDTTAENAYGAYPVRVVVVASDGTIAADTGRGAFRDLDTAKIESCLRAHAAR